MFLTGDAIVQNGATSMVGQCVIQLAKSRGIHNINIIRDRCSILSSLRAIVQNGATSTVASECFLNHAVVSILYPNGRKMLAMKLIFRTVNPFAAAGLGLMK